MDPFNFGELRKNAPKYLSLDSLKEVLQTSERPSTGYEDVSMPDQQFSDSPCDEDMIDEAPPSPVRTDHSEPAELPLKAESADSNPNSAIPKAPIITNDPHIYQPSHEHPLTNFRTCITPTQAGAQQALPFPISNVNMPIPSPWHENFRYTLSTYLQLVFNAVIILGFGYLLLIVKRDVAKKIDDQRAELIRDAGWCRSQYIANRCGANSIVPHLVENKACLNLEHCMNADPDNIRWLSSYAALVAEIMNAFVVPLQLRTVLTLAGLLLTLTLIILANYWFGFWRAKSYFHANKSNHQITNSQPSEPKQIGM